MVLASSWDDPLPDETFYINPNVAWNLNTNNRASPGLIDFVGTAEHEITEIMGRFLPSPPLATNFNVSDLFDFVAPDQLFMNSTVACTYPCTFFSIDGGVILPDLYPLEEERRPIEPGAGRLI